MPSVSAVGSTVTYRLTITNHGPDDAPGVRVVDSFPASLTGVSWTCKASPGSSCAPGASSSGNIDRVVSVAAGGTVTATVSSIATGLLVNNASVAPPPGTSDPVPGNNTEGDADTLSVCRLHSYS